MKLVPLEPTDEMIKVGSKAFRDSMIIGLPEYDLADAIELMWSKMLTIAPDTDDSKFKAVPEIMTQTMLCAAIDSDPSKNIQDTYMKILEAAPNES